MTTKKVGLLIGDENDWPSAIEALFRRYTPKLQRNGEDIDLAAERIRIHPFALRAETSYDLVVDRLAYWHINPREWLKKVALLNNVYLLNNPFTFQSMEKHTAYCAMLSLGLNIPETWLLPSKDGPSNSLYTEKYKRTAALYHDMFDLPAIANEIGYPLFMKPFDGGGWRGVSRVDNDHTLMEAYDTSGSMTMHLQKGIVDYEVFVRSLGVGPQVISLDYDPSKPMHERYQIRHDFLTAERGSEARKITKIINAFFRWDFNSCEAILKNGVLAPMDFANACPDVAVTSLHYYFPWAIKSLYAWTTYCAVVDRPMHITMDIDPYFEIADSSMSYEDKLDAYEELADAHFTTQEFEAFKAEYLAELDEVMLEYVKSNEFDHMLLETIRSTFPEYEHNKFIAHFRGIFQHWAESEEKNLSGASS